jgi:hypothetical protein
MSSNIAEYIADNIGNRIAGLPYVHFMLQGKEAAGQVHKAFQLASKAFKAPQNHFAEITDATTKHDFVSQALPGCYCCSDLKARADENFFLFVQEFDKILQNVDPEHTLAQRLVQLNNVYLTVTATQNPKTIGMLSRTDSPFSPWNRDYFRTVFV